MPQSLIAARLSHLRAELSQFKQNSKTLHLLLLSATETPATTVPVEPSFCVSRLVPVTVSRHKATEVSPLRASATCMQDTILSRAAKTASLVTDYRAQQSICNMGQECCAEPRALETQVRDKKVCITLHICLRSTQPPSRKQACQSQYYCVNYNPER